MDSFAIRFVLGMLGTLALGQACAGCSSTAVPSDLGGHVEAEHVLAPVVVIPLAAVVEPPPKASLADVPNTCDPLLLREGEDGAPVLWKQLPAWYFDERARTVHQDETRELIALVADEMGADDLAAEFLFRKSIMEASGNPGSVHLHGGDVDAGESWAGYGRTNTSERWADARVPVFVLEHGELVQGRTVRGNPATYDAWALGRGLYGMVTPLYVPEYLGADAPPWALCDPVLATVVAVWSIRKGLEKCKTDGLRDAYRWISAGTCKERSAKAERRFDRLAAGKVRGLRLEPFSAKAKADFGKRWPAKTTDPAVLLAVIRERLAQAG